MDDGFATIEGVFSQEECDSLLAELRLPGVKRSRAGARHLMGQAAVGRVARDERVLGIARESLGGAAVPYRATLFEKSGESNWLVVWHQDTALPLRERREVPGWGPWSVKEGVSYAHAPASALEQVVALRVHLDDSTSENGPLRVLPGTHTLGVLTDEQIHGLSEKIAEVECLAPRGGVLAMRPLIVHASSKSRIETPRRVLHIEYARRSVLFDGLEVAIA